MASRLSRIFLTQPGRVLLNRRFYAIPPNPPRTEEEKRARISDDPTKRTRLDKIQEEVNTIMEHHFTDEDKILVPEESDVGVLSGTCFFASICLDLGFNVLLLKLILLSR